MAAVEADRVVVALIGDTSKLDAPVNNSARQFDQSMSKIEDAATRAETSIVRMSSRTQNATRNIARQFQDAGAQAGSGQSLLTILIQQAPQVADALSDLEGKAGAVGRFFLNPWVAAATAAASALLPIIANSIKTGDEVGKLVEKMRQQSRQAELNRQADERWQRTVEGLTDAIRKRREESDRLLQTDIQLEQQALANAQRALADARRDLGNRQRDLARAEADFAKTPKDARGSAESAATLGPLTQRIARLRAEIASLRKAVADGEADLTNRQIVVDERGVTNSLDAVRAATDKYTAALGRLREERQKGVITREQYNRQFRVLEEARDREIKAAQRQTSSSKVTLPLPANGPITSGFGARSRPTAGASAFHQAIDIGVPVGTQVRAGASGVVVYAGKLGGLGNVVIVDYGNGTIAEFGHLSKTLATRGQQVNAGDVVALSGNSGVSTGPHLDYRLRTGARVENGRVVGGRYVDPRKPVSVAGGDAIANMEDAAAKSAQKIQDDFDALWDDIQKGAEQARDKIASDFQSLESALDPAAAAANRLAERLEVIEKARLTGLIDDARAAQVAFLSLSDAIGPIFSVAGASKEAGGELGKAVGDGVTRGFEEATERQRDQIYSLADLYESAFSGGTKSLWDTFKREGLRALALLAAQATFRLLTGKKVDMGGRDSSGFLDLLSSAGSSIFGRASGGHVSAGQLVRVNEGASAGRVEYWRPQGSGEIIPLGQTAAAAPSGGKITIEVHAQEGALFRPVVRQIATTAAVPVAIQVVDAKAPAIAQAGADLGQAQAYRRQRYGVSR